jgi:hypothetical protein
MFINRRRWRINPPCVDFRAKASVGVVGFVRGSGADRVVVEKANTGYPLCQSSGANGLDGSNCTHTRDKGRASVQTDKIERGMVLIPRAADWLPEFKRELLAFLTREMTLTQFLDWIGRRHGRAICELRLNGGRPLAPPRPQGFQRPP